MIGLGWSVADGRSEVVEGNLVEADLYLMCREIGMTRDMECRTTG
jgi:hypothetical protein